MAKRPKPQPNRLPNGELACANGTPWLEHFKGGKGCLFCGMPLAAAIVATCDDPDARRKMQPVPTHIIATPILPTMPSVAIDPCHDNRDGCKH